MVASIACLIATLGVASAHTIMNRISAGGVTYNQGDGIYMPSDDAYQSDVTTGSMACNGPPVTSFSSSSKVIPVKAGDTITGAWLHTLTSTGADSESDNKVISSSHKGPVMAYMKKVSDATQNPSSGPGNGWFKIAEAGLISSSQWGVDKLIADGGIQSVTIPSCIAAGDYLLRFELIALHNAENHAGAQFYMECAQLRVSGGGSTTPTTYSIPGIYSASDPGILVNVYNGQGKPYPSSYTIPGPPVFSCGGTYGSGAPSSPSGSGQPSSSAPARYAIDTPVSSSPTAGPTHLLPPGRNGYNSAGTGASSLPASTWATHVKPTGYAGPSGYHHHHHGHHGSPASGVADANVSPSCTA